jgi:hypothetical protein
MLRANNLRSSQESSRRTGAGLFLVGRFERFVARNSEAYCAEIILMADYAALIRPCSVECVTSPRPASKPATEISSSMASQCKPTRLISTCSRSAGVARNSRGNHASGTPSVRPSVSSTHIVYSSKWTLVAEMVMPCSQNEIAVLRNNPQDIRKFARIKAITICHRYLWLKPDFCIPTTAFDMNM